MFVFAIWSHHRLVLMYWLSHIIFVIEIQSKQSIALPMHEIVPLEVELNPRDFQEYVIVSFFKCLIIVSFFKRFVIVSFFNPLVCVSFSSIILFLLHCCIMKIFQAMVRIEPRPPEWQAEMVTMPLPATICNY